MILSYIYNILKFKKWKLLFFVIIFIIFKWSKIITFQPNINYLTELHKCPACFGTSACNYIHKVDITPYDFYSTFSYLFGVKNVFFGFFINNKVILKKLAHSSELNDFDRMLCENENFGHICEKNLKNVNNKTSIDFYELIVREVTLDFAKDNLVRLRLCPNAQHLRNLLEYVYVNNEQVDLKTLEINIWMSIILNPEPLLLQILPANNNWPVPKYLGACGRIVIEEYVGSPLTAYYNKSWLLRAKIASSLLNAAYMFTYRSNDFGFYLTDVSADNIAIDSNNNAKFVDLENVIIVDKNSIYKEKSMWNQLQENTENLNCTECLAYSPAEICNHKTSDHNYYAICKTLLALNIDDGVLPGGLLHNIPTDILKTYPNVEYLIEQCITPRKPFTRISAGMQLKQLLDTIIEDKN
ncbi:divergent protein kinase domain 2A-like isoform X1 [Hylaeus anthracinus]|uniref:divergent protein kinase domain 2A-like isoform X1 n=1 Tax=Hylaeus anthracinus TaxID=313031 RepID=UPI0023B904A1|nr:divergent protein kinase domain 2A-like isoform X1 [Hylaeus anthracinus]